ncbi:hypothetical protein Hanom_Chr16g01438181 [Helianthus anomalus]
MFKGRKRVAVVVASGGSPVVGDCKLERFSMGRVEDGDDGPVVMAGGGRRMVGWW